MNYWIKYRTSVDLVVICLKNGKISPRCWKQTTDLLCLYQDVNVVVKSLVIFHIDNNHRSHIFYWSSKQERCSRERGGALHDSTAVFTGTVKTKYSEVDLYLTLYVFADVRKKLNWLWMFQAVLDLTYVIECRLVNDDFPQDRSKEEIGHVVGN